MDYIKVVDFQIQVVGDYKILYYDEPMSKYLNRLLKPYYVDLKSREKVIKKTFGFKHKIPIIINDEIVLICIHSYRLNQAFYINYFQILDWKKDGLSVVIQFKNYHCIRLSSYASFIKQIDKVRHIL